MEQEFIQNQEAKKPREEQHAVSQFVIFFTTAYFMFFLNIKILLNILQNERAKVDEIRGNPVSVGTLEEMIDDNHAIVSTSMGSEYYVNICSFVNKDLLEPGSTVLLHNKEHSIIGILPDDADPMVSVMKVEKAPLESYADIGGLQEQVSSFSMNMIALDNNFSLHIIFMAFVFKILDSRNQRSCRASLDSS